ISGDITFKQPLVVRTKLSQVDGLRPGTEVRLAGVAIGKVSEVNLLPIAKDSSSTQNVEVIMKLDREIDGLHAEERVRTDARVVLGSICLLGDKVIDITPGTKQNGKPITNNGEIQGAQETSIKQLVTGASDIMSNFNLLSDQVRQIAEDLNAGKGTA